jgi:succinate dehydrogenase flavin-adding protein (antitoxin of CptAB toxin-antitoxin module)
METDQQLRARIFFQSWRRRIRFGTKRIFHG